MSADAVRKALEKLASEADGFLSMADPSAHGATNMKVLALRIKEARDALAPSASTQPEASGVDVDGVVSRLQAEKADETARAEAHWTSVTVLTKDLAAARAEANRCLTANTGLAAERDQFERDLAQAKGRCEELEEAIHAAHRRLEGNTRLDSNEEIRALYLQASKSLRPPAASESFPCEPPPDTMKCYCHSERQCESMDDPSECANCGNPLPVKPSEPGGGKANAYSEYREAIDAALGICAHCDRGFGKHKTDCPDTTPAAEKQGEGRDA
jgi:hypothetical protein